MVLGFSEVLPERASSARQFSFHGLSHPTGALSQNKGFGKEKRGNPMNTGGEGQGTRRWGDAGFVITADRLDKENS